MTDDLRQRYAEAISMAECSDIPPCANCRAEAVMAVRDEELERLRAGQCTALCRNVERDRDEWQAEAERLCDEVADYENMLTWDTTCRNCARILDRAVADMERAEKAEAKIERVRSELAEITAENEAFAAKHNPDCGCEVIETTELAGRIAKVLDGPSPRKLWRVGRRVGRTIYIQRGDESSDSDELIGVLDTRALAELAVKAVNELTTREEAADAG